MCSPHSQYSPQRMLRPLCGMERMDGATNKLSTMQRAHVVNLPIAVLGQVQLSLFKLTRVARAN